MNIIALIIGALGLVAWIFPKIGFFVGYLAFFLGYVAYRKDKNSKLSKAAMIVGGIGFGLSLINCLVTLFGIVKF